MEERIRAVDDRKELIQYICELYNMDSPTGMILKQIKDYQEQFNFKLRGILLSLKYFHETLGNVPREGDGIGIVPFMYEEAKKHYLMKLKVEDSIDFLEQQQQVRVVEIISPQFNYKKNLKPIDISSL
ncbi:hypothetical protein [Brevibacillus brevis]|uniref:hypothetical protein n=1 Tax=Brevibacillus brevis TaxID=1393 RepID=UPI003F5CC9DD